MKDFLIKEITDDLEQELLDIGFDKTYIQKAKNKFEYKTLKIYDLTVPQANILKQTALSFGADCAVHREVITGNIEKSDCILGGSFSQLEKISQKLEFQPFKLKLLAKNIMENLKNELKPLILKNKSFDFSKKYIVGVLNLTKNSFSDGGDFFEFKNAKKHLLQMIEEGADIIEIGAESTKPFSKGVSPTLQLEKLIPILEVAKNLDIPISVDTRHSKVAEECIKYGADLINDVSGFDFDPKIAKIIAKYNVPIIIQHSKGTPENMQENPIYENLLDEIFIDLNKKIEFAKSKNIENIIIDVGIGFGKTREDNLKLIKKINEFASLNYPIMLGISRKSFLNLNKETNEIKDIFTLAFNAYILDKKVNFLRVHNVKLHRQLLDNFY